MKAELQVYHQEKGCDQDTKNKNKNKSMTAVHEAVHEEDDNFDPSEEQ